jgi:hypothetical protein
MTMNRYSRTVAVAAALGALAAFGACGESTAPANGTLIVELTDAPFDLDSIQRVDVFVVRVDGRRAEADSATTDDDDAEAGGWTTLASPDREINLLEYQNGVALTLGQVSLPEGSYKGFRLVIDPSMSSLTLKSGVVLTGTSTPNVSFPSGSSSGLKIVLTGPVMIGVDSTTTMLVDFDVANSFVLRGNSLSLNGLLFKPVIKATVR